MNIKDGKFYNADQFIRRLFEFPKSGFFLFRGITDAVFPSVPKAFRPEIINKFSNLFPHSNAKVQEWFLKALKNIRNNPNKAVAFACSDNFINRICQLLITNLRYNYALYQEYHTTGFPQNCNDGKLINIMRAGDHWSHEKTFLDYVDRFYMSLIPLVSSGGQLVKSSYVMEDVTGLDETYPQHYGIGTSAIDWTLDPLIALFFTVYSDDNWSDTKFLSISAYKEINIQMSPIIFNDRDSLKNNERAVAQKGAFCYYKNPCSFFLAYGRFPSIEDYQFLVDENSNHFFEIEKISLLRTKKNILDIKNILSDNGINESSLCLNPERQDWITPTGGQNR